MNTVQLNTRVSHNLRDVGGKSFSNAGYTLSEAICIYLDFTARNITNPDKVKDLLHKIQVGTNDLEKKHKLQALKHGSNYVKDYCNQNKFTMHSIDALNSMSYKEIRDNLSD